MKKEIVKDLSLIAACGLYCGACGKYLKGNCPGCKDNVKASWCKIKVCCAEKGIDNCSGCDIFIEPDKCKKYNNFIARAIGYISGTKRSACIKLIRMKGNDGFVTYMADNKFQNIPKKM